MLMDGNPGDINDDQVSNSSLQVDKPSPTGSDSSSEQLTTSFPICFFTVRVVLLFKCNLCHYL